MARPKLKSETNLAMRGSGLHISSLYHMPREGRRIADKTDPWIAQLFYPEVEIGGWPVPWYATFVSWGEGSTADEAVMNALAKSRGLQGRFRRLSAEMAHLQEILHGARTGVSQART